MSARHEGNGSSVAFVCGLLTGITVGAAAAMLFAPKPGWEMRGDLADGADELGQAAKDRWVDVTEAASSAVDKGREVYEQARGTVEHVADTASKSADNVKGAVKDAANQVASAGASSASAAKPPVSGPKRF
jgi:gas vesicle protein